MFVRSDALRFVTQLLRGVDLAFLLLSEALFKHTRCTQGLASSRAIGIVSIALGLFRYDVLSSVIFHRAAIRQNTSPQVAIRAGVGDSTPCANMV